MNTIITDEMISNFNKKLKEDNSILQVMFSEYEKDVIGVVLPNDQLIENYILSVTEDFSKLIKLFFKEEYNVDIVEVNLTRTKYCYSKQES